MPFRCRRCPIQAKSATSKMGIATVRGYQSSKLYTAIGIGPEMIEACGAPMAIPSAKSGPMS